ncbi:MAG: hypothetical protein ACKOHG_06180, partial [Planctomycetia bacterium]
AMGVRAISVLNDFYQDTTEDAYLMHFVWSAAPVVTIFAAGRSEADALQRLRDRVTHVDAMLGNA